MDIRLAASAAVLFILAMIPATSAAPCYDLLAEDAQMLGSLEQGYGVDMGTYTCDAGELGFSPENTLLGDWTCEFADGSTFLWTYENGTSSANVTEAGEDVSADACPAYDYAPGCLDFSSDWRSLQTAEEAYYTDYNTYGCGLSGYWEPANTGLSQWSCNGSDGFGYEWTFVSSAGETFVMDESSDVDCSQNLMCDYGGLGISGTNISGIVNTSGFANNFTIRISGAGQISWGYQLMNISGVNLSDTVSISANFIRVDSDISANLDRPANITIYDLPYEEIPVAYRNGALCGGACSFISYVASDYVFSVSGFSNYTAGANARLGIYDDNDPEGGSSGRGPGDLVAFHANYTNTTSGAPINSSVGSCNISFSEAPAGPFAMSYNASSGLWWHNRTFTGTYVSWNVSCKGAGYEGLSLSDDITLGLGAGGYAVLHGAEVSGTGLQRWGGLAAGNHTTEGGNISAINLSGETLTNKWAGFFGNVSGSLLLADNQSSVIYQWLWSPADGGAVCASTNQSLSDQNLSGATGAEIDSAWGFAPASADSGTNTFNYTNCSIMIGMETISGADCADTGQAGAFMTRALGLAPAPAKAQMLFCTNITNGQMYDGSTGNYELIVPASDAVHATETYYFYANLG